MLIKEIIQRVQSLYSKGVQSDDTRLSSRHIYSKLKSSRAKLIKQKLDKNQITSSWNTQVLPCVELEIAPAHECPCLPPIGCSILKSKHPLPKPVNSRNKELIEYVTSLDGSIIYSKTSWDEKKYKKGNKYTSEKPDYYIRNGYLYLTHKSGPRVVTVGGVFEDPVEAISYSSYCTDVDDCVNPLETDFPIDEDQVDTLVEMASKELVALFSQMKEDLTNDSKDSVVESGK